MTFSIRNGRTSGITHPSLEGQESVIKRAYKNAGNLDPSLTGYFECHGTGTPVGDPIEVSAIGRVFAPGRHLKEPLLVGSVCSTMLAILQAFGSLFSANSCTR